MTDEEAAKRQQERFQQFLKALDALAKSNAKLAEAVAKQSEVTSALFDVIADKDNGLISAIDDLIDTNTEVKGSIETFRTELVKAIQHIPRSSGPIYPPRR